MRLIWVWGSQVACTACFKWIVWYCAAPNTHTQPCPLAWALQTSYCDPVCVHGAGGMVVCCCLACVYLRRSALAPYAAWLACPMLRRSVPHAMATAPQLVLLLS